MTTRVSEIVLQTLENIAEFPTWDENDLRDVKEHLGNVLAGYRDAQKELTELQKWADRVDEALSSMPVDLDDMVPPEEEDE